VEVLGKGSASIAGGHAALVSIKLQLLPRALSKGGAGRLAAHLDLAAAGLHGAASTLPVELIRARR
jgi:hypothetical protein